LRGRDIRSLFGVLAANVRSRLMDGGGAILLVAQAMSPIRVPLV
jgi:hypothetical protein